MKLVPWNTLRRLFELLEPPPLEREWQTARIRAVERDIILPIKVLVMGVLCYYLFFSRWFESVVSVRDVALEYLRGFYQFYVAINVPAAWVLMTMDRLPLAVVRWTVFTIGLVDGLFLAALTLVTGGVDSILYWAFPGLIIRGAASLPLATQQIVLNVCVSLLYVVVGVLDAAINRTEMPVIDELKRRIVESPPPENPTEPFVLRIMILWFVTACCYGVQVLLDKQRRADQEAREFAVRREQLGTAGRLAAEVAHQIKNPLGIINNAAFSLERALQNGSGEPRQHVRIIREEVERANRVVTEIMGYAQLAEGKVEKLKVTEELERAIQQVFPPGADYKVKIHRDYAPALPALLMQRNHLSEVFANLLQNAREAMAGRGELWVSAGHAEHHAVVVSIRDSGPGIPADRRERIFEPYFTTKEKGTGLGLAIVKHNTEIYGGTVRLESELGSGARFVLRFPARTLLRANP